MSDSPAGFADERIPLVPIGTESCFGESTHSVFSGIVNTKDSLYDAAYRYLRSSFCVGGLTICVAEVTVLTQSRLGRCFPNVFPPKKYCDAAVALMRKGGLHVIVDVDGVAGAYLLNVITGSIPCASGFVLANGVPVEAGVFRKAIGTINDIGTPMPNLTVEENINFVVSMRTRGSWGSRETLVEAACVLTELDRRKTAKLLSSSEAFRLRLAMEVVRDPPVIVAYYPLDHLGPADAAESSAILKRISTVLEKTVIISSRELATHLFSVVDTVLLFGRGGCVLYSGETTAMPSYFQSLHVPRNLSISEEKSVQQGRSASCDRFSSYGTQGSVSSGRGSGVMYERRHGSYHPQETRSTEATDTVLCGDDVVDLATLWAESETLTAFYTSKFYDSQLRRQMVQAITRCSSPPKDVSGAMPFTSTAPPQYAILKPFLLWRYDALQRWRDPGTILHLVCLSLGLLTISLLMEYQNDDQGGMYNIRGIEFVLFLLAILVNIPAMGDVDHQLRLFFYQRNSGLYGTFCFIIVFVFRTILVRALYLAFFVPVVLFVLKMKAPYLLILGFMSVAQVLLHVAVHAIVPNNRWAAVILWLYLSYSIFFCGFLLNLNSMPPLVGKLSILRWGYGAALAQSLRDMPFSCDGTGNTSYCYSGNAYLELEGFLNESTELSLSVFSVLCGVLIVLMGVALACRG